MWKESGRSWYESYQGFKEHCAATGQGTSTKDNVAERFLMPLYTLDRAFDTETLAVLVRTDREHAAVVLGNLAKRGLVAKTKEGWVLT